MINLFILIFKGNQYHRKWCFQVKSINIFLKGKPKPKINKISSKITNIKICFVTWHERFFIYIHSWKMIFFLLIIHYTQCHQCLWLAKQPLSDSCCCCCNVLQIKQTLQMVMVMIYLFFLKKEKRSSKIIINDDQT